MSLIVLLLVRRSTSLRESDCIHLYPQRITQYKARLPLYNSVCFAVRYNAARSVDSSRSQYQAHHERCPNFHLLAYKDDRESFPGILFIRRRDKLPLTQELLRLCDCDPVRRPPPMSRSYSAIRRKPEAFGPGLLQVDSRKLLRYMRKRDELCDVEFVVDGERFPAHRIILSVCSKLLSDRMKQTGEREVVLHEVEADIWRLVLDFLYWEKITFRDYEHCLEVLKCAERFMLDDLVSVVINCRGSEIDMVNVWDIADAAHRLNNAGLQKKTTWLSIWELLEHQIWRGVLQPASIWGCSARIFVNLPRRVLDYAKCFGLDFCEPILQRRRTVSIALSYPNWENEQARA